MMIDGKQIASDIEARVREAVNALSSAPVLAVVAVAPDFATGKFMAIKKRVAESLGIEVRFFELPASAETTEVVRMIEEAVRVSDGVVLQLPMPPHINRAIVLAAIPLSHDVDGVGAQFREVQYANLPFLPPVVGAIDEIASHHHVTFHEKKVVIVGEGLLVGAPARAYAEHAGAEVVVVTKESESLREAAKDADIIILGSGVPGLLLPDMVKNGVVIFDAGTSEDGGKLSGDADPACAEVASLMTPVPGGIGPVTVAVLFKNLLFLTERSRGGR